MSVRDVHKPAPSDSGLAEVAAHFARIASSIEAGSAEASIMALMEEAERFCGQALSVRAGETKALLPNLVTALQTWRTVWQRLGRQQDFRLAVAREARQWSARIEELAQRVPRFENGNAA